MPISTIGSAGLNQASDVTLCTTSGNVGIGTASPTNKLDVVGGNVRSYVAANNGAFICDGAAAGNPYYGFSQAGTLQAYIQLIGSGATTTLQITNAGAERMRINSSGNVLVGTTTQIDAARVSISGGSGGGGQAPLGMVNPSAATKTWNCGPDGGGNFCVTTVAGTNGQYIIYGATAWSSTSDERLKTTLVPFENAIDKICTLRAGTGRYLRDEESVSRAFLIAQDVQAVLPEAVNVQDDEIGTLGLQYTDVIPLLVAAIKEQNQLITQLQADVAALKGVSA